MSELINLPVPTEIGLTRIQGVSAAQTQFALKVRNERMRVWDPDLPDMVFDALRTVDDAAWWLANKDAEVAKIKWPISWAKSSLQQASADPAECPGAELVKYADEGAALQKPKAAPVGKPLVQVFAEEEEAKRRLNDVNANLSAAAERLREEQARDQAQKVRETDFVQFETFARKAANSPELAYLAMLALLYRQTRDPKVLAKFKESRERVAGHLVAIDGIVGE